MVRFSVADVFPVPTFVKPRQLRQTWLKDVGYHEAPGYREHLGLAELDDFLEVAGPLALSFALPVPGMLTAYPLSSTSQVSPSAPPKKLNAYSSRVV